MPPAAALPQWLGIAARLPSTAMCLQRRHPCSVCRALVSAHHFKGFQVKATAPAYPVSSLVARFIDRLTALSAAEWDAIQRVLTYSGLELSMVDASRNAAVALAVRDLISTEQFEHLYRPFADAIPLNSLDLVAAGD